MGLLKFPKTQGLELYVCVVVEVKFIQNCLYSEEASQTAPLAEDEWIILYQSFVHTNYKMCYEKLE